jgi:hypothetical protein
MSGLALAFLLPICLFMHCLEQYFCEFFLNVRNSPPQYRHSLRVFMRFFLCLHASEQ